MNREEIVQGYINTATEDAEIRVRRKGGKFFQTIKSDGGLMRREIEVEISEEQFDALWPETDGRRLEKTRYEIPYEGWIIELDVYGADLEGLIVAEVEFVTEEDGVSFTPTLVRTRVDRR